MDIEGVKAFVSSSSYNNLRQTVLVDLDYK